MSRGAFWTIFGLVDGYFGRLFIVNSDVKININSIAKGHILFLYQINRSQTLFRLKPKQAKRLLLKTKFKLVRRRAISRISGTIKIIFKILERS